MITPVYVTAGANSDANGNITFTFPAVPTDVWLVTLSVPNGLTGSFTAVSAGVTYGQWQGVNGTGPLWIPGPGSITITGSNLTPSSPFTAVAQGSSGTMADIPPQAPTPTASSVQATRTQQFIQSVIVPGAGAGATVQLSPNWRSLYIGPLTAAGSTVSVTAIQGQQSKLNYGSYLAAFSPGFDPGSPSFLRIPLFAGVDTSIGLTFANSGATQTVYIGADNDPSDIAVDDVSPDQSLDVRSFILNPVTGLNRPLPSNSQLVDVGPTTGTGNVLAAPASSGVCILIGSLFVRPGTISGTGAVAISIIATVGGTTKEIAASIAQITTLPYSYIDHPIWPTGILCDANTAVTYAVTGGATLASSSVSMTYDLVTPS
jgi:hypothetical protein